MSITKLYNDALTSGKLLDVSNINVNTGEGAVIIPYSSRNHKGLFWNNNLIIASRYIPQYIATIQLIFGNTGFVTYNNDIIEAVIALRDTNRDLLSNYYNIENQGLQEFIHGLQGITKTISRLNTILPENQTLLSRSKLTNKENGNNLRKRLENMALGYVLDVSNMNEDGSGVREIVLPKSTRSGKFGTENIPIISNNINNYIRALRFAYGDDADTIFINDINAVDKALRGLN